MSTRIIYEAYSLARAVEVSCGTTPSLAEALEALEEVLTYPGTFNGLDYVAELLRDAAQEAKMSGCLDWYVLDQAADTLEHAY